jgi:energy-coupling factor transporter ATP-binding protein EcfA2
MEIRMFEIMNECDRLDLNIIKEWLSGIDCKYLIVKHDKDLPRAPHFHIFVKMANKRKLKDIAKHCNIETQYIERVKNWKNALGYAFHLTDNAKNDGKHEYNNDAIISSRDIDISDIFKLSKEYEDKREHNKELERLLFEYGNCEISKSEMLKRMSAEDYNKYALMFKRMQEYRIMKVRDRNMNVIYITGASGSGKTTLAKYMARILNYDFFVSGSGKDILDGYDKEECIILDDLRADVFTKAELFKLTDNNTNSSVKSRFKNKDISYCKLMIITSIKTPKDLYNWDTILEEDKDETFNQFARRIGNKFLYIMEDGTILECTYDMDFIKTNKKVQDISMNDVFMLLGIEKKVGSSIMNDIFKKIKNDIEEKKCKYEDNDDLPF